MNDAVPARVILYFLSWSGFVVSFMMRNDMNIALVAMTTDNKCLAGNNTINGNTSLLGIHENVYNWSSFIKSAITSSFFAFYILSQMVGGFATQSFGTKKVFGWSQFFTALSSLCIPVAASTHYALVILLRCIQGFASGLMWPAMFAIVGFWIPLKERSRFMSSFQGFSVGIGVTYVLCGFIINNFGWSYVFFTTGTLGMFWCLLWYFLAFNTPQEHPRITNEELEYINIHVKAQTHNFINKEVPWKCIFTSIIVWSIAITTFGRIWIHYIFIVYGPNFMKNVLHFSFETNGIISGMPFICSYISSVIFCYIADQIIIDKMTNLTIIRKLFTGLSQIVPGMLLYTIGYTENLIVTVIMWFVAIALITASYAGAMANIVDIAPNYAGQVLAFCQTIHMSASFISPLAGGIIITNNSSIEQWRILFAVSSAMSILSYFIYLFFGSAETQNWNKPVPENSETSTNIGRMS